LKTANCFFPSTPLCTKFIWIKKSIICNCSFA
jgi:hypothetical protein